MAPPSESPEGLALHDGVDPTPRIDAIVETARAQASASARRAAVGLAHWRDVSHFLHGRLSSKDELTLVAKGVPASTGAASGRIVLSTEAAIEAASSGEPVILVRAETAAEDVVGMQLANGVVTARGGIASHAALVARGWGIPAVVGVVDLEIEPTGLGVRLGERLIGAGEIISIDGATGEVFLGGADVATQQAPESLTTLLSWADEIRAGRVGVMANADNASDVRLALSMGADGVGLCRTEHMFLQPDRLAAMRRFILSDDPAEERSALDELEEAQSRDFEQIFAEVGSAPVTIRLLDAPFHEFLPRIEDLVAAEALGELDASGRERLALLRRLAPANPMMATRGVRMAVLRPDLYPMQVRSVCRAAAQVAKSGVRPDLRILIPLIFDAAEMATARRWVSSARAELTDQGLEVPEISVGAMIETPRAALVAGSLPPVIDFASFGTNDLTQLTYGLSRDDVEADVIPLYLRDGIMPTNPFEVLDPSGVGALMTYAVTHLREKGLGGPIGACGEHAGDPASVELIVESGVDYVSCSPFRVPLARLLVAQALIKQDAHPSSASPEAAPEPGPPQALDDETDVAQFWLLHALRLKGMAGVEALAETAGVDPAIVRTGLERLQGNEIAHEISGRGMWRLTDSGRDLHDQLLPGIDQRSLETLRLAYDEFLPLNTKAKELCTAWQIRDGAPNDHDDSSYDQRLISQLVQLGEDSWKVLTAMEEAEPRFANYRTRISRAVERVTSGDHSAFTGVMRNSFHDVWMELHQDLILLLGIDRSVEGSF